MTREEIINQLTPIAREVFAKPDLVITDELSYANLDSWTSLAFMQFLTAIEEHFGFKYKMMEIIRLQNMKAVILSIQNHIDNA